MTDIYNSEARLERFLERINKCDSISEKNKELIFNFKDNCFAEGLSISRVLRYLYDLSTLARLLEKDFDSVNIDDIKTTVMRFETEKLKNGKEMYSESTREGFRITLKKFYNWQRKCEDKEYPPEVKWIKTRKVMKEKNPNDFLTEEDIKKLIEHAESHRNKALVSTLSDSGLRISELLNLRIKDVRFDEVGAVLHVKNAKHSGTGSRFVRVIFASPYLKEWFDLHPLRDDSESYIFVTKDGQRVKYPYVRGMLERLRKGAGIKKRVNPHNFRASKATWYAKHKVGDRNLMKIFGWRSPNTAGYYVALADDEVDKVVLDVHQINREEREEPLLKPITCVACKQINAPTTKYCVACGFPLDEKLREDTLARRRANFILNTVVKEEKGFKEMLEKVVEKKIKEMLKRGELN